MKKIASLIVFMLIISSMHSQSFYRVPYYNWSSKTSFMLSPSPMITGYGYLSDSLSKAHHDTTFYEYNGEYYPITCWADYYFWYVNKYWYYFDDPGLYEYYYMAGDEYGMAQYICGTSYHGYMYPARIAILFPGREVYRNYYSVYRVKRYCKNDSWENKNYVAISEKDKRAIDDRKRNYVANNLNQRNRQNNVVVRNYKVGERKLEQNSDNRKYFAYTNGPSNSERIDKEKSKYNSNILRESNSYQRNTNSRVNYTKPGSTNRNSNSSVNNYRSANRAVSGNIRSNSSRQTVTKGSGR